MREWLTDLWALLVFPGFAFLFTSALAFEWLDRRVIARLQGRVGPPWYQPLADFIKLMAKEALLPTAANRLAAAVLPLVSLAAVLTAGLYVPVAGNAAASFEGDLIVVLFLLSLPALAYFLAGWISVGVYSVIGGNRSLLQYFSYEVPFLMALTGPAIFSGSWSIAGIVSQQAQATWTLFVQPLGFLLAARRVDRQAQARSAGHSQGEIRGHSRPSDRVQRAQAGTLAPRDGHAECGGDVLAAQHLFRWL
jgi:NADH-quinone oxidoreductase subunit H